MNDIIKQMIDGYINAFAAYPIKSQDLNDQVEAWKGKLTALAESVSDPTAFYPALMESGLQEEYSNLITKVTMASMASGQSDNAASAPAADEAPPKLPTVREFLDQYRTAYDAICSCEYRIRGKEAYERLFAVADRTEDMLDAQLILERERLLWKIVSEDALDIYETLYKAMDPLYEATSGAIGLQVEMYKKANSEEELTWLSEMDEIPRVALPSCGQAKINMVATLALHLIAYCKAKIDVWNWENDRSASSGVVGMISSREAVRRTLDFIKKHFDMDFDQLLSEESWKIWLLNPASVDKFARIKTAMSPHNYEVFRDVVYNEILTDMTIPQILQRKVDKMIWFDLDLGVKDKFESAAQAKADQMNSQLIYYKYADAVDKAFGKES